MPTPAFQSIRPRTLADAGLAGPQIERFKTDHRSTVWSVDSSNGLRVVKRFEYSPLRQRLSLMLGNHPAQTELRWNQRLQAQGVPVVPIVEGGIERWGIGSRVWLATAVAGVSLQRLIREEPVRRERGEALLAAAAKLTCSLFAAGFWSRDLKPSNIIVDEAGQCRLIDVGSVREGVTASTMARTLAVMDRVLARDGVEESLRRKFDELVARR